MSDPVVAVDVLCVGNASFDMVFAVSRQPGEDEKMAAAAMVQCGGGPAANAAVTVSRLGLRAAFAGYLGNDAFGDAHLAELKQDRVNTDLVVRGGQPTPVSVVLVKPGGARSLVSYRANDIVLPAGFADPSRLSCRVMLFDGHQPTLSLAWAKWARQRNLPTVLDAGSVHAGTMALVDKVDYLIASEKFALEFTGRKSARESLTVLAGYAPLVVVTMGEKGLVWEKERQQGELPAYHVDAVDTTGAGDVFHGAFAAGLAQELDFIAALRYASVAAALCCMKMGARPGIPGREEVCSRLDETRPG